MTEQLTPPLTVKRWRRFGHDRAYVSRGETPLGYLDVVTGAVHCDDPADVAAVERATADLAIAGGPAVTRSTSAVVPPLTSAAGGTPHGRHAASEPPTPPTRLVPADSGVVEALAMAPDEDLALRRPGEGARQRAREIREERPVLHALARVVGIRGQEYGWRIGADGEEAVGKQLAKLSEPWRVLHSVPVGERVADLDHVVIGPAGVFVINTKHHPDAKVVVSGDTIWLDGHRTDHVRNSRYEARRAAELLGAAVGFAVPVSPMIVVVGSAGGFTVRNHPNGVLVVQRRDVIGHLTRARVRFGVSQIEAVYAVARHLSTWCPTSVARSADF